MVAFLHRLHLNQLVAIGMRNSNDWSRTDVDVYFETLPILQCLSVNSTQFYLWYVSGHVGISRASEYIALDRCRMHCGRLLFGSKIR